MTESLPSPTGVIIVVRVAGEVDLATVAVLETTLVCSINSQPAHLLVDLARLQFCSAQGMSVLFRATGTAAERGFGYALSSVPPPLNRLWDKLWPDQLPTRYSSTAVAVLAIRARQAPKNLSG